MSKKSTSIKTKIIQPMLIVLFCQVIVIFVTVLFGGITKDLKNNAYELLTRRNESISDNLANQFRELTIKDVEYQLINDKLKGEDPKTKEEASRVFYDVEKNLEQIIINDNVTGAFIILDDVIKSANEKVGIYVRKQEYMKEQHDNFSLKVGSLELLSKEDLSLKLGSSWDETFKFGNDNIKYKDFYNRVINEAKKATSSNYRDYEYWSKPFNLSNDGLDSVTYTLPLINDQNKAYGVIGVEISIYELARIVDASEINSDGVCPLIAYKDGQSYKVISLLDGETKVADIVAKPEKNTEDIYNITGIKLDGNDKNIASLTTIEVYDSNKAFEKDDIWLFGTTTKDAIFSTQSKLAKDLAIGMVIAFVLGSVIIVITSSLVTRPIAKMVTAVKKMNPSKVVKIERVGITQIDALAASIENLSKNVSDNASKLSKIIDLVNMPIGAFEYYDNSNMVYCTESFFKVIGVERENDEELFINMEKFKKILSDITKDRMANEKNVYRINKLGKTQYIRVKMLINDQKTLGVIVDVTDDILKKQKIEFERDHDVLTGLYNRIAFKREVENYMNTASKSKIAAFLMWDLDSLKYMNDTFGHDIGDKYIKMAADSINKFTKYGGISGRVGGDEFTAFVGGFDTKDEIRQIINKVKRDFESMEIELPNGDKKPMRASMGVSWYPHDSLSYEELSKYADYAMYEVKKTTKGDLKEFDIKTYKILDE